MIESYAQKHFGSAHRHLFASAFDRFLKQSVPQVGGPEVRQLVIDKIIELFDTYTTSNPGKWYGLLLIKIPVQIPKKSVIALSY